MAAYTTPPAKKPEQKCPGAPRATELHRSRYMSTRPLIFRSGSRVIRRLQHNRDGILFYKHWRTQSRRNDRVRENFRQLRTELGNVLKDLWDLGDNDRDRHTTCDLVNKFFRTDESDESYEDSDEDLDDNENTPPCTPEKQIRRCTE